MITIRSSSWDSETGTITPTAGDEDYQTVRNTVTVVISALMTAMKYMLMMIFWYYMMIIGVVYFWQSKKYRAENIFDDNETYI